MAESEGFDTSGHKPAVSQAGFSAWQPLKKSRALAEFSAMSAARIKKKEQLSSLACKVVLCFIR